MKTILFLSSDKRPSTAAKIAGAYRYAKVAGLKILVADITDDPAKIGELIDFWRADGCIAECGRLGIPPDKSAFGKAAVVYLDANPGTRVGNAPIVIHDSEEDGKLAARELILIGCTSFAFIAYPGNLFWSRDREAAFIRSLRLNGRSCRRFMPHHPISEEVPFARELKRFVQKLPEKCGIFAANDLLAAKVVSICSSLNRKIPDDIALLGVDNNEKECENAAVTISSIAPDFERGGYLATEMLDKTMRRQIRKRSVSTFGPIAIIRRESTSVRRVQNSHVIRALAKITGAKGIVTAAVVIKEMNCSRRVAEIRFREATGRSILEYISNIRLENACATLRQKHIPLSEIPDRIGYRSYAAFDRFFLKSTGFTPSAWRKNN